MSRASMGTDRTTVDGDTPTAAVENGRQHNTVRGIRESHVQ